MNDIRSIVFDAILKEAVTANFRAKMEAMPSEEEIRREHPLSERHIRRMKTLFAWERRQVTLKKLWSISKAALIFLCVLTTITFALLMTNPTVRAAVRDAIVRVLEGFTSVEFTGTDTPTKDARDFSPRYVPQGYTQFSVEEYGDNCLTIYMDADSNILMLDIGLPGFHAVDTDHREYYTKMQDGIEYHIYEARDTELYSNIVWSSDGHSFRLSGVVPIDELLKMALSME
jgi:hypothetical protein